jgi:hypothetical protein
MDRYSALCWYPWAAETFELATIAKKPVCLIIGVNETPFSAPVLADTGIIHAMTALCLPIGVAGTSRPDIAHVYGQALQILQGTMASRMAVFCLPTGHPFAAYALPDTVSAYTTTLAAIAGAWTDQRDAIDQQAQALERAIVAMNTWEKTPVQDVYTAYQKRCDRYESDCQGPAVPVATLRLGLSLPGTMATVAAAALREQPEPPVEHLYHGAQWVELNALAYGRVPDPLYRQRMDRWVTALMAWPRDAAGLCVPTRHGTGYVPVTAWAIIGVATAAATCHRPDWQSWAESVCDCAETYVLDHMDACFASDIVPVLMGGMCLNQSIHPVLWAALMDRFYDSIHQGVWLSQLEHRTPITRGKPVTDTDAPHPNGLLLRIASHQFAQTKDPSYLAVATGIMANGGSIVPTDTFWLGAHTYWQALANDGVTVVFMAVTPQGPGLYHVHIVLETTGYMVSQPPAISVDTAHWVDWQITPVVSRRMPDQTIVRCATGCVTLTGRLRVEPWQSPIRIHSSCYNSEGMLSMVTLPLYITKLA